MEGSRREIPKQLAIAVAASLITLIITFLLATIWSWIVEGGVVHALGGVTRSQLTEKVETKLEEWLAEKPEVAEWLPNAVILTDQECRALGQDWRRYEKMDGRFPLGAGDTVDGRGQRRKFLVGEAAGRYRTGDDPGHNMPPYLVMNSCHRVPTTP